MTLPPPVAAVPVPAIHLDPDFRRLWTVGLLGSLVRWLETLVFGVFAYQQTQSAFWVASMMMLRMLPMALFGVLVAGVAARISRRSGLLVSQGVLLATTLVLLALSAFGALEVWHLAVASFIGGSTWAGDMPMRRGLIGDIAGPARMGQAMAMDAVGGNACRLAGPALGGLLLAQAGMPAVFLLAALLYLPALVAVLRLTERPPSQGEPKTAAVWSMLVGGWRLARDTPPLAATLWITILFNLFCWPVLSMVPVIGHERLQLSTQGIGLLASMDGLGSLLGALALTSLARRWRYGHVYVGGLLLFLLALPVFALSVHPFVTGAALLVIGLGQAGFAVMQSTLVFVFAPPHRRVEAMGLMTMCVGIAPIGFLGVGWLAQRFTAPAAAVFCSLCGLACLGLTWRAWRSCLGQAASARAPIVE